MTPIYQTEQGDERGDCFRACIASILDLPRAEVPHFFQGLQPGQPVPGRIEERMRAWFGKRALALIQTGFQAPDAAAVMEAFGLRHPGLHYVLTGKSAKGRDHAVVCRDMQIVHDPARVSLGLHAPQDDGMYHVFLIGMLV